MLAAGESREMPVKNHQQPSAGIIFPLVALALGVHQLKRHGGVSDPSVTFTCHALPSRPAMEVLLTVRPSAIRASVAACLQAEV